MPAELKVYESVAEFEPLAPSATLLYVPISVAPVPLESVARWNKSVKPAFVLPVPVFAIIAESVTAVPAVALEGLTEPAERSGDTGLVTVRPLLHG